MDFASVVMISAMFAVAAPFCFVFLMILTAGKGNAGNFYRTDSVIRKTENKD